jgi:hypothetical protein
VSAWLRDGSRPAYLDADFAYTYTTAWDPVTWSASCGEGTDDDIGRMVDQRLQYLAAREEKNKGKRRTSKPTQQGSDQGGGDTRKGTSASAPRSILKRKQPVSGPGTGAAATTVQAPSARAARAPTGATTATAGGTGTDHRRTTAAATTVQATTGTAQAPTGTGATTGATGGTGTGGTGTDTDTRKGTGTSATAPRSILKRKQPGKDAGDGHGHGHGPGELPPVARCHGVPPITIHDALTHRRPASWPGTSTSAWHFATHTGGTASTAAPPASACVCPVYC